MIIGIKKEHIKTAFAILSIAVFILFKISDLDYRFGDGNGYVYMAQEILSGSIPYRDFVLADPPVFVFILALFKIVFGNNILLFQALPIIAESATAFLIYLLLKKYSNSYSFLAPLFYLFSFSVLATTNFFTGVQFVVLFFVSAILFYERGKPIWSGIFWAFACLVKLYAIPAFIGFSAYLIFKKEPTCPDTESNRIYQRLYGVGVKKLFASFIGTFLIATAPFAITIPRNFFDYTFFHHLRRPSGIGKMETLSLYGSKEWLILILGFIGMFFAKRKIFIAPFAFSLLFLLIFKDIYYLYLNILLPFLIISVFWLVEKISLSGVGKSKAALWIFFAVYFAFMSQSIFIYSKEYKNQGRFPNAKEISEYAKTLPEGAELYGSHEIAPTIALLSGRKIFENIIDTNTQIFSAKTIDIKDVSERAADKGMYLIAKTDDYPEYGISDFGFEGYFDGEIFKNNCSETKRFPVFYNMNSSETSKSKIGIYLCEKK